MKPKVSEKTTIVKSNINEVWNILVDNEHYKWRSNIDKINIVNDTVFIERTKQGQETKFFITKKEGPNIYEFDMENDIFTGHFTACLKETKEGGTKITLIEEIYIKNFILKIISPLFFSLENFQNNYIRDLREALKEEPIVSLYNGEDKI